MIQVIDRAFRIMEELSLDGEVSLESLARISKLNKGTLCNILRTLIELGYARRTREGHYQLTEKIRELSQGNNITGTELEKMRACVSSLAEKTGESGVLSLLRHTKVAIAAQAQHQRSLMVNTSEVYAGLSLFGSVSGRILIAFMPPKERELLCRQTGYPGAEWDGADDAEKLEKLCAAVRSKRLSFMENPTTEIISFAVPVKWHDRTLALGLTMPLFRCPAAVRRQITQALKEHAAALSAELN